MIGVVIADPLGKPVFTQTNSPFGWYDEESSSVEGKEFFLENYLFFLLQTYGVVYSVCFFKVLTEYVSKIINILQQKLFTLVYLQFILIFYAKQILIQMMT